ncbi:unnamed protein product [Cylindrotheca closterium]|uniref:DUF7467 domain-containing protein n=1 Tax=Cylindrotheca closterium TaxID=2856 RepID=A0AAD2CLE1_9STRA|nr:unnamed protein product [Cylindrotheca closterium]
MTRIPSLRIGLLAAAILSSTTCHSSLLENDSRLESIASSVTETSRLLSKQALIAYGRPPNTGGSSNVDDSEEENAGNVGDMDDTNDMSEQESNVDFDRPSNTGSSFDFDEGKEKDQKGGMADMMLVPVLGPECDVAVNIGCIGSNDIQCDQLQVPSTQCSIGRDVMNLGIKLISSDCHQSRTTQNEHFACERTDIPMPDDGAVVEVICYDMWGWEQIIQAFAFVGETEINLQKGDGDLPDTVMCILRDNEGNEIQRVKFDTSGTVDLFLKNAFGMIQLESCTVRDRPTQSCKMPVQYSYTVSNQGLAPLSLMKVERSRNSNVVDLTPLAPVIELRAGEGTPGEATSVVEDDILDLCIPEVYETTVTASSDSLQRGTPCFDFAALAFQFPGIGHMDIAINCLSADGLNCTNLGQKAENCWTPITYTFDVKNVGTTDLIITYVEVLQKGNELDMASFFLDNKILPTEKTRVNYVDNVNLCVEGDYETTVTVKAESVVNGTTEVWENYESYPFEIKFTPFPTGAPTTAHPSRLPSATPTNNPTPIPSAIPSVQPATNAPTQPPTPIFSSTPTMAPSQNPTLTSSENPTLISSGNPTLKSSETPTSASSQNPTLSLSQNPTLMSSETPTSASSQRPTLSSSQNPTSVLSGSPTSASSQSPTLSSSQNPTSVSSGSPTSASSHNPTLSSSQNPTSVLSGSPTSASSQSPTLSSSQNPTSVSSGSPTSASSQNPTLSSSQNPTLMSSDGSTNLVTSVPTPLPTTSMSSGDSVSMENWTPSARPSQSASITPSLEDSTNPSQELSSSPTVSQSNRPTVTSSTRPTDVVSALPSTVISASPTSNPTSTRNNIAPLIPSDDPTSLPTKNPSKQPTEFPTSSPTHAPSAIPSFVPTISPSAIPSDSPTQNPTEQCTLRFDLACSAPVELSPDGSCTFIYNQPTACQEQPSRLKMRYNGGDCTHSSNLQGNTFFSCEDFGPSNDGPSNQDGSIAFIRVVDYDDKTAIRFDGFVRVGEDVVINGMGSNLNVTVYDPKSLSTSAEIMKPENILQTLVFHTTCPVPISNLFLKDRFGSIQIVEFENALQGVVSCFQELTLNVEISSDFEVDLLSTNIVSNIGNDFFGIYNLTDEASGVRINKSQSFRATQKVTIDLVRRKAYSAQGVVVGKRTLGNGCYGSGMTTFTAGAPLPPSIPTLPPTVVPSASAAPSTDPLFTRCDLEATISCTRSDGGSCGALKAPVETTCIGESAKELSFTYIPSSNCNETKSQDRFICNDANLALKRPFTSFVRIFRGTDIFYEGAVSAGQLFRVPLPMNTKEIEAALFTVSSAESAGTLLEQMQLSVACREKDGLTLLQKYGHLQLNGFVNEDMGSQQIFANLDLTYTVQNKGIFDALLTTATTDSPFTGIGDEVLPTNAPRRLIASDDTVSFTETATVNLVAAAGQDFDFFFEIAGVSTFNNFVCSDIGELSLQIL